MSKKNNVFWDTEICARHKPLDLGYMAWHTEAEKRAKKGMEQKQCPKCKRFLWKDEF